MARTVSTDPPAYVALSESGELARRAERAAVLLAACELCPRRCRAQRATGELGTCGIGARARVASYGPHHGEESVLRGWAGSGTVFFGGCNLRCRFCQNEDIAHRPAGSEVGPERLAAIFLDVQAMGCHNLNLVTPSHVVPQILAALALAAPRGLRLPIVYNTGGYDAVETLALLDGVVDVYMPDVKLLDAGLAERYLTARDYPDAARRAVTEMHRQVGDLTVAADGLAVRGVLVRHLVLPGLVDESARVFAFLAGLSRDTFVNVMDQYRPCADVARACASRTHGGDTCESGEHAGDEEVGGEGTGGAGTGARAGGAGTGGEGTGARAGGAGERARRGPADSLIGEDDPARALLPIARRVTRDEFVAALDAARAAGLRRAARSP